VAVVRLQGVIAASARGALSLQAIGPLLERAFRKGRPSAVALIVNSPGGSPAQSSLIGARVRALAEDTGVPVHAFVEDVAASGGYWLACAADDIWIDDSSITGSIGVISASFGFSELLSRWGIERRVHTAGEDKSMLDPFRPERAEDVARLRGIQSDIHATFIDWVRSRRGDRLDEGRDLFTGEIFVGRKAIEAGLADGIAHPIPKLKELYGERVRLQGFAPRRPLFRRLGLPAMGRTGGSDLGGGIAAGLLDEAADRALWARFGL
jgi:serine protease SohB